MTTLLTTLEVSSFPMGVYLIGDEDDGLIAWVVPFGARIMQIFVRMRANGWRPVTLGFNHPECYLHDTASMGAICGRYANRIGNSSYDFAGKKIELIANHAMGHCLHGGTSGFGVTDWTVVAHSAHEIQLARYSPNHEMGFPGNCSARCTYRIVQDELVIELNASVTETGPLNLVQHSYFCLNEEDLAHHELQIFSDYRLLTGDDELPTQLDRVAGSDEDFRTGRKLAIGQYYQDIDRAFLLSEEQRDLPTLAACLSAQDLKLTVFTTERFIHAYTAGQLEDIGSSLGPRHIPLASICLESEDWPNGPNLGKNVWYGPQKDYRQTTRWCFSR